MKFTVRDIFDCSVETYWNRLFFDEEYNRRLYAEALGFKSFSQIELTGSPGERRTRIFRTEPTADAPSVVRKLIGDSFSYTEHGAWEPETGIWTYRVVTSTLAEKITIGGRLFGEERPGGKMERVAEVEISVKIFGVGGAIEKYLEKTTRDSYVKATKYTNDFIREKGLGPS